MPKNKVQGVIFGILMSITMAYGMEVYNVAWKLGIPIMAGGFSNMTNGVFADAFIEASYMWIFVFLFSNLWGARRRIPGQTPYRPRARQCLYPRNHSFLLHRPCHVPHDEPCCKHPIQHRSRGHACEPTPRHLGGHAYQKFPHGAVMEPLRGISCHASCLRSAFLAHGRNKGGRRSQSIKMHAKPALSSIYFNTSMSCSVRKSN